jgi:uncharacterized protein YjiS (DUF1127 family)
VSRIETETLSEELRSRSGDWWPIKLLKAARRWQRARSTYRQLSELYDRQLKDIGLTRSQIRSVAIGMYDRTGGR